MGIRFLCPNGHKLHVKAFLSGKKAICPKCGVRVIVPDENPAAAASRPEPTASHVVATEHYAEVALEESLVDGAMEAMSATDATAGLEAQKAGGAQPTAQAADPIDVAPGAVWYVRPAGGGQFGPASADIMRHWLDEGRVSTSSLVWRAGWTEWRSAASTFPQLAQMAAAGPAGATAPGQPPTGATPAGNGRPPLPSGRAVESVAPGPGQVIESPPTMPPLAQVARKRRRKNDVRLIASAILVALTVILVIVLVLVFRGQSGTGDPKIEESSSADEESLI